MNHTSAFGAWLTELQKRLSLSDTRLAALLNVTAPAIAKWKYGGATPSKPEYLDKLAELSGEAKSKVYTLAGRGQVGMDLEELRPNVAELAYALQARLDAIADPNARKMAEDNLVALLRAWTDSVENLAEFIETLDMKERLPDHEDEKALRAR